MPAGSPELWHNVTGTLYTVDRFLPESLQHSTDFKKF